MTTSSRTKVSGIITSTPTEDLLKIDLTASFWLLVCDE